MLKKKFEAARKPLVLRADPVIVVMKGLGGSSHGSKNILCGGWSDFRAGGATPSLADLHGLAVVIGSWTAPIWVSWIGLVVAGGLSYFGLSLATRS